MNKETDILACKKIAIDFLNIEPEPIEELPILVIHPFIDSRVIACESESGDMEIVDIFEKPEKFEKAKSQIEKRIMQGNLETIFAIMLNKYHLAFLKYAKPYISKEDFERHLAYAWVASENPNQDINVSIPELIKWFKSSERSNLMEKDELEYYNKLPDTVNVYRGIAVGRAEQDGLSWTCNIETAKWFANRFNTDNRKGYVIEGKISKENIFAYFNNRGEDEILCNSKMITSIRRINLNDI